MTSKTGKTAATLTTSMQPPSFAEALGGAVLQLAVVLGVWFKMTPAAACVPDPRAAACLGDCWGRQVLITLGLSLAFWLYSLRTIPTTGTSDPSIVDRLWSILPVAYSWHFYLSVPLSMQAGAPRVLLMAALVSVWGTRLTYNFAKKGGFSGGEDYRWEEIRTWFAPGVQWESFNLLFICLFQQLVVLAFTSPVAAAAHSAQPLTPIDALAALIAAALIAGEAVADAQMFAFQTEKYRRVGAKEPLGAYARGFIETGLWSISRHPNYFCEVSLWWAVYLFSIPATGAALNWTVLGPVFLTCLFVLPRASLDLTELLSCRKYKDYPDYQARVPRFVPFLK